MKRKIVLMVCLLMIFTVFYSKAQNNKAVAVDGYFTSKDSLFVSEYLGADNIKSVISLQADSAMKLLGDAGKSGLIIFNSINSDDKKSKFFRQVENRLFTTPVCCILNGAEIKDFKMNSIHPSFLESVNILAPLVAAQKYGKSKNGGVILIKTKKE